jgi:PAS domain S-box-containing protein
VKTGVILDANKGAERLLGRSRRKIIGMHQSQLHPPEKVKYYTEKFLKHVRNNRTVDFEAEIVKKDGTTVPVYISAAVMELQGKKAIQGIFGDITERKRAEERVEEQLRFLQTLVDTLPTPIFYKGKDGKYTGCNKAFEEFVGRQREKIIGKTVYDIGPKRIADKYYEKDREL